MYRFNIWKIVLIIGVLVFSILYLIPTPDSLYNPLYGNLPLWMQEDLPPFEVTEDNELKVNLAEVEYREGISFQDTTDELEDVFGVHLGKLDFEEGVDYEFDTTEAHEFYVRLISEKARQNPQATLDNLHLYGSLPKFVRRLIPDTRLKLGLDLKGGVHLVLEVDLEASKAALFKEHAHSIPDQLRTEDILCREVKQVEGQNALNVFVGIPSRLRSDAGQKTEYLQKAQRILNEIEFFEDARRLSDETETQSVYQLRLTQSGIRQYSEQAIEQVLIVLRNRVDAFGVSEPSIRREANRAKNYRRVTRELKTPQDRYRSCGRWVDSNSNSSGNHLTGGNFWSGTADTPPPDNIPEDSEIREHG